MLRGENAAPHPFQCPCARAVKLRLATNAAGSRASYFLRRRLQNSRDDVRHAIPLFGFRLESALARSRETVVLGLAFIFRFAPFTGDPALVFQPVERGIERALLNLQAVFRNLLDAQQNAVAMQRAERDGLEDQHVQSALQQVDLFRQVSLLVRLGEDSRTLLDCQGEHWRGRPTSRIATGPTHSHLLRAICSQSARVHNFFRKCTQRSTTSNPSASCARCDGSLSINASDAISTQPCARAHCSAERINSRPTP